MDRVEEVLNEFDECKELFNKYAQVSDIGMLGVEVDDIREKYHDETITILLDAVFECLDNVETE